MKPFTWSWSRHRTLAACERRYWYDYYGSRDGWRGPADPRTRDLYEMKRLVGRAQWIGQVVHDVAARVLVRAREGQPLDPDIVAADADRAARRAIADARRGLSRLDPRRHVGFAELYYGEDPGDASWNELVDELVGQVRALLDHPIATRLLDVPSRIVEVERLERIVVGETGVWVALDVLVDDGRGGKVVVDWKTGRFHDDETVDGQLGLYALYVHRRYGLAPEAIQAVHASTRDNDFRTWTVTPRHLAIAADRVASSSAGMVAFLPDPGTDAAPEEAFSQRPEGDEMCAHCRYRRACERE